MIAVAILICVLSLPAASALCLAVNLCLYCSSISKYKKQGSPLLERTLKERRLSLIVSAAARAAFLVLLAILYITLDNSVTYQYQH